MRQFIIFIMFLGGSFLSAMEPSSPRRSNPSSPRQLRIADQAHSGLDKATELALVCWNLIDNSLAKRYKNSWQLENQIVGKLNDAPLSDIVEIFKSEIGANPLLKRLVAYAIMNCKLSEVLENPHQLKSIWPKSMNPEERQVFAGQLEMLLAAARGRNMYTTRMMVKNTQGIIAFDNENNLNYSTKSDGLVEFNCKELVQKRVPIPFQSSVQPVLRNCCGTTRVRVLEYRSKSGRPYFGTWCDRKLRKPIHTTAGLCNRNPYCPPLANEEGSIFLALKLKQKNLWQTQIIRSDFWDKAWGTTGKIEDFYANQMSIQKDDRHFILGDRWGKLFILKRCFGCFGKTAVFSHSNGLLDLKYDGDKQLLCTGGKETTLYDFYTQQSYWIHHHEDDFFHAALVEPVGLFATSSEREVLLWDYRCAKSIMNLRVPAGCIDSLDISPNGLIVAARSQSVAGRNCYKDNLSEGESSSSSGSNNSASIWLWELRKGGRNDLAYFMQNCSPKKATELVVAQAWHNEWAAKHCHKSTLSDCPKKLRSAYKKLGI